MLDPALDREAPVNNGVPIHEGFHRGPTLAELRRGPSTELRQHDEEPTLCRRSGCLKPRYTEGDRVHDFCGKWCRDVCAVQCARQGCTNTARLTEGHIYCGRRCADADRHQPDPPPPAYQDTLWQPAQAEPARAERRVLDNDFVAMLALAGATLVGILIGMIAPWGAAR